MFNLIDALRESLATNMNQTNWFFQEDNLDLAKEIHILKSIKNKRRNWRKVQCHSVQGSIKVFKSASTTIQPKMYQFNQVNSQDKVI